jgi:hypothetical protein
MLAVRAETQWEGNSLQQGVHVGREKQCATLCLPAATSCPALDCGMVGAYQLNFTGATGVAVASSAARSSANSKA